MQRPVRTHGLVSRVLCVERWLLFVSRAVLPRNPVYSLPIVRAGQHSGAAFRGINSGMGGATLLRWGGVPYSVCVRIVRNCSDCWPAIHSVVLSSREAQLRAASARR